MRNSQKTLNVCMTTGLAANTLYFLENLLKAGARIPIVLVQTDKYRARREKKALRERRVKYLIPYFERYIFLKHLKMTSTPRGLLYGVIRYSRAGIFLRNLIKGRPEVTQFPQIVKCQVAFSIRLHMLRKLIRETTSSTRVVLASDVNSTKYEELLKQKKCDVLVISGGKIIRKNIINAPTLCTITIHNSVLPKLRGWGGGEIWALIHNQYEALGTTVFYTDEGVDTGDILLQRKLQVSSNDSLSTLRYKNIELGNELLSEAIHLLQTGKAPRYKQNDSKASYINRHPTNEEIKLGLANLAAWKIKYANYAS